MTLPELDLQLIYGRLSWSVVLLTLLTSRLRQATPVRMLALLALMLIVMCLPGQASPAWWLLLAFQYPSALLLACCLLHLHQRAQRDAATPTFPLPMALGILGLGGLLYLDTFGLFARGLYHAGFDTYLAPSLAVAIALACLAVLRRAPNAALRGPAGALLLAIALFSALRLPSGNLFDALVDPLLCCWALGVVLATRLRRRAAAPRLMAQPFNAPAPARESLAAESVSSMKESIGGK